MSEGYDNFPVIYLPSPPPIDQLTILQMNTIYIFSMVDVMISLLVSYSYIACSTSSQVVSLIKGIQPPESRQTIVKRYDGPIRR